MPQNQHRIKSEYTTSFKTYKESAQAEYSENMKFRLQRRNKEVSHQPWAWLDIDLSEDESENNNLNKTSSINSDSKSFNKQKYSEEDYSNDTNSNFDASGAVDIADEETNQKLIQQLKNKAMKRAIEIKSGQGGISQHNQHNNVPRRPHHPVKGNSGTFQHHNIADSSNDNNKSQPKPLRNLCSVNREKPFLSYGWGSKTAEGNQKKTFNIKSDIDVYPSAIRALHSRQSIAKQHKDSDRPKTAGAGKTRNKTVATSRNIGLDNNHAAIDWLSEYQYRFPIYDNEVYRRGLANLAPRGHFARLDTPRTCRI